MLSLAATSSFEEQGRLKRKQEGVLPEEPAPKYLHRYALLALLPLHLFLMSSCSEEMTVETNVHTFKDDTLDDSLYSRQRYVLGDFAMNQLQKAHIFLSGLGGVGIEISMYYNLFYS